MPREIETVFEHRSPAKVLSERRLIRVLVPNNRTFFFAGRKIGRETVDYVRNILKYWVAYHPALDQRGCAAAGGTR